MQKNKYDLFQDLDFINAMEELNKEFPGVELNDSPLYIRETPKTIALDATILIYLINLIFSIVANNPIYMVIFAVLISLTLFLRMVIKNEQ